MMPVPESAAARFWARVEKTSGCWEWRGWRNGKGYGAMRAAGKTFRAHRLSYLIAHGELPEGMCVCHHCDNPPCVNPDHLFIGTKRDNAVDMCRKGRNTQQVNPSLKGPALRNAGATHCIRGHAFTAENTVRRKDDSRDCRECRRLRHVAYGRRRLARKHALAAQAEGGA